VRSIDISTSQAARSVDDRRMQCKPEVRGIADRAVLGGLGVLLPLAARKTAGEGKGERYTELYSRMKRFGFTGTPPTRTS